MLLNNDLGIKTGLTLCLLLALAGCSDSNESAAGEGFKTGVSDNSDTNTDDSDNNSGNSEFDQKGLLTALSQHVFVPSVQSFETKSQTLISTVTSYCQAIETESGDVETHQQSAKQAWVETMNQWQQLEVMQVGPLTDNDGKLRNIVYSWPTTSQCSVDQDVGHFENGTINDNPYDITRRTNTRRGLDAAEYLLFNDDLNHSCSKDSLAPAGWNDRTDTAKQLARCNFTVELATDINNTAKQITMAWTAEQSGFHSLLTSAGESGNKFESAQAAINHITDAMFYVDSITKDAKLAAPIGLSANSCGDAACVADVESRFSHNAVNNIRANMVALQSLFLGAPIGTDALGFDDYLKAVEQEELANTMATDIKAAIDATDAFEGTMTDAVTNTPNKIQALHLAVKKVTDNLKSLFITYLSLELPLTSAGDAD